MRINEGINDRKGENYRRMEERENERKSGWGKLNDWGRIGLVQEEIVKGERG